MFDNGLFVGSLGLIVYGVGLGLFFFLLISSIRNYHKNHSYSVGGFFIVGFYLMANIFAALVPSTETTLLPGPKTNLVDFIHIFFFSFGVFMSFALIFYFLMSCVRMLFEKFI